MVEEILAQRGALVRALAHPVAFSSSRTTAGANATATGGGGGGGGGGDVSSGTSVQGRANYTR